MRHKRLVVVALLASLAALLLTGGLTGAVTWPGVSGEPPQGAQAAVVAPGLGSLEGAVPATPLEVPMPGHVSFQGRLTDPSTGDPVADGMYTITFRIFDAPTGPSMLWEETQVVEVYGGLFNVILGSVTPFPDGVFSGGSTFLEVQVSGDPPMTPRLVFNSVPYAFYAETANFADTSHWGGLAGIPAGFADNVDNDVLAGLSCANGQVAKWNSGAGQWQCGNDLTGGGGDFWALTGNSGTNPSTNFVGTTDNQPLVLKTNGAERARLDASGLDLAGDMQLSSTTIGGHDWAVGSWADSWTGEGAFFIEDVDAGMTRFAIDQNTGDVGVMGGGSFSVDFGGAVGNIMLSTPAGAGPGVIAYAPNGNRRDIRFDNGGIRLMTSASSSGPAWTGIRIDEDSNVGIGTSSPQQRLHVESGSSSYGMLRVVNAYSGDHEATMSFVEGSDALGAEYWLTGVGAWGNTNDFIIGRSSNSPAVKMLIEPDGDVGIGTSTPQQKLHVNGIGRFDLNGGSVQMSTPGGWPGIIAYTPAHEGGERRDIIFDSTGIRLWTSSSSSPSGKGITIDEDGSVWLPVLHITGGSDLAEPFDVEEEDTIEPGMVLVIDPDNEGQLEVSRKAYDRLVAGVVSGAGGMEPGLLMSQSGSVADGEYPLALTGRAYVWADASNGPIEPGDLLTTSDTPGHAMKVTDYERAQGAVIGKAMSSLEEGQGLVLVLVGLQ